MEVDGNRWTQVGTDGNRWGRRRCATRYGTLRLGPPLRLPPGRRWVAGPPRQRGGVPQSNRAPVPHPVRSALFERSACGGAAACGARGRAAPAEALPFCGERAGRGNGNPRRAYWPGSCHSFWKIAGRGDSLWG
eukprot:gene15458-biopygen11393